LFPSPLTQELPALLWNTLINSIATGRLMYLTFTPTGVEFAYRHGIFPMYNQWTGDIEWYRPDPRTILPLDGFHISRSLAKTIRQEVFEVRINTDFEGVMQGCAANRTDGTWITEEFIWLYGELHRQGKAHC